MKPKLKTYCPSVSADKIDIKVPTGWNDLNERQLQYILQLQADAIMSPIEIRVSALYRFGCIELNYPVWVVQECTKRVEWMDHPTADVCRLSTAPHGYTAYEAQLSDLRFGDYLTMENLWQSTMAWSQVLANGDLTQSREAAEAIDGIVTDLAKLLYMRPAAKWWHIRRSVRVTPLMRRNIIHWLTGWHLFAQQQWSYLFRPSNGDGAQITPELLREQVDVQIQALTCGDVTKVRAIMDIDTWTALNMLNSKQRDAEIAKREHKKNQPQTK